MPNQSIIQNTGDSLFLYGPYGSGKTTLGTRRLLNLLDEGVPGGEILIITPQRTLQQPYRIAWLESSSAGETLTFATIGGLARRSVDLFWPLIAQQAGFAHPERAPLFLTLESAQYYMAHIVRPLIAKEGFFSSVSIPPQRLYSQILDNLNKAAGVGFPHTEIGERLSAAWIGNVAQKNIYADVQTCANRFRQFCLQHNLLDFSLQLEIFVHLLWPHPEVRAWLTGRYRHLIYDNVEEDLPRAHDIFSEWLPYFDSALLIYDTGGGHRQFLSADPNTGWDLGQQCDRQMALETSYVISQPIYALHTAFHTLWHEEERALPEGWRDALHLISAQFYPQLLDEIVRYIADRLAEGILPEEIVILSPYLSDALRFALQNRLQAAGIPTQSHRPSRALRDEPAVRALLTLAQLAHPQWQLPPDPNDLAAAFLFVLQTDLVRAHLLQKIVWHKNALSPFEKIHPEMQERLGYALGQRYSALRLWLEEYQAQTPLPLDHFLRLLFGEILSQPGYGFHRNLDAARSAHNLIESIGKFRHAFAAARQTRSDENLSDEDFLAREYLQLLDEGLIAAQYVQSWEEARHGVLIAPAFTFLMMNQAAHIQIWLDPGANGWTERLFQPLTHPYVLSRNWAHGTPWRDEDEVRANRENLQRLVSGLLLRCSGQVTLGITELGETGFEERGALLQTFQKLLQKGQNHG